MTCLKTLNLGGHGFTASDVVECGTWKRLNLPQPPDDIVAFGDISLLVQFSDRAAFAETRHPDLPLQLLQRTETSDHVLAKHEVLYKKNFKEAGCRVLVRARSLTHLTGMTYMSLHGTDLESSGASHFCSALTHLTGMTDLILSGNNLTADDGARICCAAAAAGMTCFKTLNLGGHGFTASDVVECGTWKRLNLPQPPHEVI
jgi:hypothetical protein